MLSVVQNPSFKLIRGYTNKKKKKKVKRNERTKKNERRIEEENLHRFGGESPWKDKRKKGGKERQKSTARPNPMKTFWVIVNSSMRQSTIPLIGEWREEREQYYSRGWPGVIGEDWRLCAWVVHYDSVDSPIRCAAFTTERSCQSVWKVRPVANCDLSRGKTRWSRLTACEKGRAWRSVPGVQTYSAPLRFISR